MIVYKLFSCKKNGTIGSLFINKAARIPRNRWVKAENIPTKGFKIRPGWHCLLKAYAPHLSKENRSWYKVQVKDYYIYDCPNNQGNKWVIANYMKVLNEL